MRPSLWLLFLLPCHIPAQTAQNILQSKCFQCHSHVQSSGLDLRTPESLKKGGKRGPAVIPGNAAASLLFKAIKTWIDSGATYESTSHRGLHPRQI